jgi:hypothetical protein
MHLAKTLPSCLFTGHICRSDTFCPPRSLMIEAVLPEFWHDRCFLRRPPEFHMKQGELLLVTVMEVCT